VIDSGDAPRQAGIVGVRSHREFLHASMMGSAAMARKMARAGTVCP
jgi:hypothetical protein